MTTTSKIFSVESHGRSGINEHWSNKLTNKECAPIDMAIPPEFEGPGGTYSPEDLYALALMNCYFATFKYIAEKSRLIYDSIHGSATLYVEKGQEKSLWMDHVEIKISLSGSTQPDRALAILEKTKSQCMIINSVKTAVSFEFHVES
ncbi:MAG: OsmC family protein [Rhizobacter sp.]|nr:OsmC family protein [Bacteriovorax sp.]